MFDLFNQAERERRGTLKSDECNTKKVSVCLLIVYYSLGNWCTKFGLERYERVTFDGR